MQRGRSVSGGGGIEAPNTSSVRNRDPGPVSLSGVEARRRTVCDIRTHPRRATTLPLMNESTSAPDPVSLRVKIFADGAEVDAIRVAARIPHISGFTTNPTLMRKAGVENYEQFGREVISVVANKPVSFEVFSDD